MGPAALRPHPRTAPSVGRGRPFGAVTMEMIAIAGLFGAAAAAAAAPWPCILVVASRAATGGLERGLCVTLDIMTSSALLLAAAWAMILGLLSLSDAMFEMLRIAGLGIIVVFAVSMLRATPGCGPARVPLRIDDVGTGLLLGLSNPLQLLFMFALLPQFVPLAHADAPAVALATGAVLLGIAVPMVMAAGAAVVWLGPLLRRSHLVTRACGGSPLVIACLCAAHVLRTGRRSARTISRLCGGVLLAIVVVAAPGWR